MSPGEKLSIDGDILSTAQRFYAKHGFEDTSTPWLVGEAAYLSTCPPEVRAEGHLWRAPSGLFHVASAEQGFIQMMFNGQAIPSKAQSTTPCFRWEQVFDNYHLPFFYKLELYDGRATQAALFAMISLAKKLYAELGVSASIEPLEDGSYDLVSQRQIELGSFGIRSYHGHVWTYGTGIALPRFTDVRANET